MFMPFDRQSPMSRHPHFTPVPDATGTPFTTRHPGEHARAGSAETKDFREQADGAP